MVFMKFANPITQIGSCDRSSIHVPNLGGTDVWPEKNSFQKRVKKMDTIAVYLIIFLKWEWKSKQIKTISVSIDVPRGNLQ